MAASTEETVLISVALVHHHQQIYCTMQGMTN